MTELRLQWLAMRQRAQRERGPGGAVTVQLVGSVDDIVSPNYSIDLVSGADFHDLSVQSSGHRNVIEFEDREHGKERKETFLTALLASREELRMREVFPSDDVPTWRRDEVTDVVFVMHGIRDLGFWTIKIANEVRGRLKRLGRIVETETSSTAFFQCCRFSCRRRGVGELIG